MSIVDLLRATAGLILDDPGWVGKASLGLAAVLIAGVTFGVCLYGAKVR